MTTLDQELIDTMKEIVSNGGFENISQELQDKLNDLRGRGCTGRHLEIKKRKNYLVGIVDNKRISNTTGYSEEELIRKVNEKILKNWEKAETCPCFIQHIHYI